LCLWPNVTAISVEHSVLSRDGMTTNVTELSEG